MTASATPPSSRAAAHPGGFDFSAAGGLGDIFDQMFGDFHGSPAAAAAAAHPRSGADIQTQVEIDLTDAFAGAKTQVRVPTRVSCEACKGTGSRRRPARRRHLPDLRRRRQGACAAGLLPHRAHLPHLRRRRPRHPQPLPHLPGRRHRAARACAIQVTIPPGVEDGTRIRLQGEGEAGGQGATNGDLYVHIAIRAHNLFHREGAHVFCEVPLRMSQAALGDDIEVPVIDGTRMKVKIPAGTQTGAQFRLRGKGFSVLRSTARGDMVVQAKVETPQHLTRRQRELLEEFEAEASGHSKGSPEHEGFFAKMKEFLGGGG